MWVVSFFCVNVMVSMSVIIRPSTPTEEYNYVKYLLSKKSFYEKHGYSPIYPKNVELLDMIQKNQKDSSKEFESEEYDKKYYVNAVKELTQKVDIINLCTDKLKRISYKWAFKFFEEYTVRLTRYGPGGSYDYKKGVVIMLVHPEGLRTVVPEHVVIHELVHIGIEESIVIPFELTHREKERVVDLFVKNYFKDLLPQYKLKTGGGNAESLDKFITSEESINVLPSTIENYIEAYPR